MNLAEDKHQECSFTLEAVQSVLTGLEEGSGHTSIVHDCHCIVMYGASKHHACPILVCLFPWWMLLIVFVEGTPSISQSKLG